MGAGACSHFLQNSDTEVLSQMPFADDVRKYAFRSLDNLVSKKGDTLKEHGYLPTTAQLIAMENFADQLDLTSAGEPNEDG